MAELRYPDAPRLDIAEQIFGHVVRDPYRWLEDADSAGTRAWQAAQDALFAEYAASLPAAAGWRRGSPSSRRRARSAAGLARRPPVLHAPHAPIRSTPCCYTGPGSRTATGARPHRPDGASTRPAITTLDAWQPDKEGQLLAYQLSEGGDEESVLRVMDVATGQDVDGPIDRCRYSVVAWLPGTSSSRGPRQGVLLRAAAAPRGGARRRGAVPPPGLPAPGRHPGRRGRHDLRRGPGEDQLLRRVGEPGRALAGGRGLGRHRAAQRPVAGRPDRVRPEAAPEFRVVQEGVDARTGLRAGRDGRLYVHTDLDAPRGRLAIADPADPAPAGWRDLSAEDAGGGARRLRDPGRRRAGRPLLLAGWTRHAISEITVHDLATGQQTGTVPLPGLGTHRRAQRAARGRPRGLVRLHRQHHARASSSTTTRAPARCGCGPRAPGTRRRARRCAPSR